MYIEIQPQERPSFGVRGTFPYLARVEVIRTHMAMAALHVEAIQAEGSRGGALLERGVGSEL